MAPEAESTGYGQDRADRISLAGTTAYSVNAKGNLITRGGDTFAYDQGNRLTSATVGGATSTNAYSGDGLRVSQTAGGSTTNYVWDVNRGLPVVLLEGDTRHVWGATGLEYSVAANGTGAETVYHKDGLGSVRSVTDAAGVVLQTYRTDEFGVPDAGGTKGSLAQSFQYTGEPRDASGLVYLRARYYEPGIGRFISRDPFPGYGSAPLSLNRYVYVQNNPTSLTDPSGLNPWDRLISKVREDFEKSCLDPDSKRFCWLPGIRPVGARPSSNRLVCANSTSAGSATM